MPATTISKACDRLSGAWSPTSTISASARTAIAIFICDWPRLPVMVRSSWWSKVCGRSAPSCGGECKNTFIPPTWRDRPFAITPPSSRRLPPTMHRERAPRCGVTSRVWYTNSSGASKERRRLKKRQDHRVRDTAGARYCRRHNASKTSRFAKRFALPRRIPRLASMSYPIQNRFSRGGAMNTVKSNAGRARRALLCAGVGALCAALFGLASPLWAAPVTINIVDVAGNLALTQDAIEGYQKKHPELISKINFTKAPAPELPGKLKAMQGAGRSDIDMVLTGTDFLAAGIEQGVLIKVLPEYASKFPNLTANYQPAAAKMQELAHDYGVAVTFMPAGPLVEYNPDKVKQVPTTPAELLAWCKANPNRLIYARPANSGPGRTFIMGLPYILGDKDPKDPVNGWEKTWAYLKDLNSCIEYYPTGTGAVMKELGEGSRDITLTMTGWDINPRVLGIVPKSYKVAPLKGMTWINDAHYMVIPKGVPPEKIAAVLDLMAYLLTPEAQAYTYDKGYFYPGPAVKNVSLSMAPKESQDAIKEYGRPEYEGWLAQFPHTQSLEPKAQVEAFRIWDQQVGTQKTK